MMAEKENSLSRAVSMADLIKYQSAAVVSKEILRKSTGTITIFAFDKGQGLSEHKAPFDALVIIADGTAEITLGGKKNILKKGQLILMPANVPHALKAIKKFKMLLVMMRS